MEPLGEVLTVKEAARHLRCHVSTIYRMLKSGDLPAFRIGHSDWRFLKASLDDWMVSAQVNLTRVAK